MLKNFANFIISGKFPAFVVVFCFLLIAFVFPLASVISGAALVLVTLYAGPRNSTLILFLCTLALTAVSLVLSGNPIMGLLIALVQLVPSLLLATVFYKTRSLALSLQFAALLGVICFIIIKALYPNDAEFWTQALTPLLNTMVEAGAYTQENGVAILEQAAQYMTGILVASIVFVHSSILFFGHWLFSQTPENAKNSISFKDVRLGKVLAVLAIGFGAWAVATQSAYAAQLCGISVILFFLQGMAVIHSICDRMTKGKVWLIISYILVIFIPQAMAAIILLGLADTFLNMRKNNQSI